MNCRDFLLEFEERRGDLTEAAILHVKICVECQKTSGEQTRVWLMIDNLRRIDAPNDFDFRVKAKIANSKPADFQPRFLPALRYVLPVSIVVLLLGLVAFNANYFSNNNSAPQTAVAVSQMPLEKDSAPVNSFASNQIVAADTSNQPSITSVANLNIAPVENTQEKQSVAFNLPPKPKTTAPKKNAEDDGGSSRDLASTRSSEKLPYGINPNRAVETLPNANNQNSITDEDVWEFIGIKVVAENGNRKVTAVLPNTTAERSGVKTGDVIEAINGEKLSAKPLRVKTIEAKTLTIMRGTEKIEINLQS